MKLKSIFAFFMTAVTLATPFIASSAKASEITRPDYRAPRSAPVTGFLPHQAWVGRKPLLVLPVQYDSSFNLSKEEFAALMPYAEQALQRELEGTGKFSVLQVNKHNATFSRGVLDEKVTQSDIDTLVKEPTLDNANKVLSLLQFDTPPLIAQLSLAGITVTNIDRNRAESLATVQARVIGNLYQVGNNTPIKTVTADSNFDPRAQSTYWTNDRVLLAISDAGYQVAREFVAPVPQVTLPGAEAISLGDAKPITWKEPSKAVKAEVK